jgi:RNA polymerase II subunit A-like phosphatase
LGETRPEHVRPSGPYEDEPDVENVGTSRDDAEGLPENPDDDDDEFEREMLAAFEDDFDDNAEGDDMADE